ncbi:hypothetical protein HanHA300_Chr17g0677041 [Helianthus annuus]|nr:hypothetical protein HanHA300_Chr17g0677041 [Helianthus annuus]KAJ0449586.1 hypothetical protein HanHA89_Chr17g0730211 [Helianthus annuus]
MLRIINRFLEIELPDVEMALAMNKRCHIFIGVIKYIMSWISEVKSVDG